MSPVKAQASYSRQLAKSYDFCRQQILLQNGSLQIGYLSWEKHHILFLKICLFYIKCGKWNLYESLYQTCTPRDCEGIPIINTYPSYITRTACYQKHVFFKTHSSADECRNKICLKHICHYFAQSFFSKTFRIDAILATRHVI